MDVSIAVNWSSPSELTAEGSPEQDLVGEEQVAASVALRHIRQPAVFFHSISLEGFVATYNSPETGVVLVGGLVELLVLRHAVGGVDHTAERCSSVRLPRSVRRTGAAPGRPTGQDRFRPRHCGSLRGILALVGRYRGATHPIVKDVYR